MIDLVGKPSVMPVSPHLQFQASQGSPHDCSLQEPMWCKQPSNNSAGGMRSNTQSLSSLTSLPPMASNIFSSCTRNCWMLFIRMQGWRDKSRWLLLFRMPTHHHQWETLCLNTFARVPPDARVTQQAGHAQISALKYGQFPVAEYPDEQTSLSTRSTEQSVSTSIFFKIIQLRQCGSQFQWDLTASKHYVPSSGPVFIFGPSQNSNFKSIQIMTKPKLKILTSSPWSGAMWDWFHQDNYMNSLGEKRSSA